MTFPWSFRWSARPAAGRSGGSVCRRADDGLALITVLVSMFVASIVVGGAVAYLSGNQNLARRDQNWNAALAAAEAGLDDYLYRLMQDEDYWTYCAADIVDSQCPAPDGNPALYASESPEPENWTSVPGGDAAGEFSYRVNAGNLPETGALEVEVTGRVGNSERTIAMTLRRRGFLDYLYFTDFETKDPFLYTASDPLIQQGFTKEQVQQLCGRYFYDDSPGAPPSYWNATTFRDPRCGPIGFAPFDEIRGPLHSNDAILVYPGPPGMRFLGNATSSWAIPSTGDRRRYFWNAASPGTRTSPPTPTFSRSGDPRLESKLSIPPDNKSIRDEAVKAGDRYGCLYTGPTRIIFSSDGTMRVWSPFTSSTSVGCPVEGASGPIPPNGVIYVQSVPVDPADDNFTSGCPYTAAPKSGHPLTDIVPLSIRDVNFIEPSFGYRDNCRSGDAFVEGTLRGRLTIATERNVIVTEDLVYATPFDAVDPGSNPGLDLLGLIAKGFVEVYHPVITNCSDGIDNDRNEGAATNDGLIDFPADPGCRSPQDNTERNQCNDGRDNNNDGRVDFPRDPRCTSAGDDSEAQAGYQEPPNTISTAANRNLPVPVNGGAGPWTNPTIHAAMLAIDHSIRVQQFNIGAPLGTLRITGVMAQRYRGIVGTSSGSTPVSGVAKNYVYDKRLQYLSPPHFLAPSDSQWRVTTWREIRSAR
jgi:type II secretory pathway pseudopilin PulG